jgi:hypothetical protein
LIAGENNRSSAELKRFKITLDRAIIIAHNEYIERSDCASLRTARQEK